MYIHQDMSPYQNGLFAERQICMWKGYQLSNGVFN